MKIMEKVKNEDELANALRVSIKCGWRQNDAINALHDEHNAYIRAKNISRKNEDQFHVN